MEVPNTTNELAVWSARMRVCSTCGPLGNAVGSTPPPAIGAWLRAHLPTNVAAALDRLATPPQLACINLVSSSSLSFFMCVHDQKICHLPKKRVPILSN